MEVFRSRLEPSSRNGAVQRFEMLVDLGGQRRSHLAGAPGAAAGAGSAGIIEQQCAPLRRILDLGKPVATCSDAPNRQQQQAGRDRLAQKSVKSCVAQAFALLGTAVGGQGDDAGRQAAARLAANALPGRQAVHVGHMKIHQQDIEVPCATAFDGLEAAGRELQRSYRRGKCGLYEIAVDFVVVHREDRQVLDFLMEVIVHGAQYTPMSPNLKCFHLLLALAAGMGSEQGCAALKLEMDAGPTRLANLNFERIEIRHRDATHVKLYGMSHAAVGSLGDLAADCPQQSGLPCATGTVVWTSAGRDSLTFGFERDAEQVRLTGDSGARLLYRRADDGSAALDFRDLPFDWVPSSVREAVGVSSLSGSLAGSLGLDSDSLRASFDIRELGFDTPEGRFAGDGVAVAVRLAWRLAEREGWLEADWNAGELLLGPAYLPGAEMPLELRLEGAQAEESLWRIARFELFRKEALAIGGDARIRVDESLRIESLDLEIEYAELGPLWAQGLDSLAGTLGGSKFQPTGRIDGRMRIEENALVSAGLRLSEVGVDDAAGRLELQGLGAWIGWDRDSESLDFGANWSDARLYRIPLGPGAFDFSSGDDGTLALTDSFRLPVLDGVLVVERLAWRDWARPERQLTLDARLEPIELSGLTNALGWTEFGGRLSGRFPGIRVSGSVIDVQGGLDIELFGGHARVDGLSIERPFGSLPALAADIEFESLDLEQVTGAFEFGRMLGLMSGYVRELRLLDWQPVRFDAWFETLETSPQRKISQKAVGSISSLSGGGSAALSSTLLRWFDDFPYRKFGLGCRLAANVCEMRGLHEAEQGGYVILEGRLIPRLNIVGFKRRVDWPRLLSQLQAAAASSESAPPADP